MQSLVFNLVSLFFGAKSLKNELSKIINKHYNRKVEITLEYLSIFCEYKIRGRMNIHLIPKRP